MEHEDLILNQLKDKCFQAARSGNIVASDFIGASDLARVENYLNHQLKADYIYFGGYEDAERVCVLFPPDYLVEDFRDGSFDPYEDESLVVLRLSKGKNKRELSHRDYLGSLMGEGLKREKIGDILVRDDGADIIVSREIGKYLEAHYSKAGRVELQAELVPLQDLKLSQRPMMAIHDTVPSLRIDCLIASAFGISRSKALEEIKRGMVFVNNRQIPKASYEVKEGDKITLRGKGKAIYRGQTGLSKKGRLAILIEKYV